MELFLKILRITFWLLLITGLTTIFAFVQKKEDDLLCRKIHINVLRDPLQENYFVNENAIRQLIARNFGQVENTSLKNININYLERLMYANPWVERADVYVSIDGVVDVEIEQRQPVLRIINTDGENYYLDSHGKLMLWSPDFTPRMLVASGNIKDTYAEWSKIPVGEIINSDTLKTHTMLDDLYAMAKFILADGFWSAHVEQIYVNALGDIELVPKVGDHKIIFGSSEEMTEKFWKLKTFYKEGLNYTGWDRYDTLNLKFNNQVVCSKVNFNLANKKKINNTSNH